MRATAAFLAACNFLCAIAMVVVAVRDGDFMTLWSIGTFVLGLVVGIRCERDRRRAASSRFWADVRLATRKGSLLLADLLEAWGEHFPETFR